jgi:hypothetical protein
MIGRVLKCCGKEQYVVLSPDTWLVETLQVVDTTYHPT